MAKGGPGVVIVESGGLPVTQVTGGGNASPFTVVTGNGFPVTLVDTLGIAVALYNVDGSEYSAEAAFPGDALILTWDSLQTDLTPEWIFDYDDVEIGDVVTLQRASDSGFTADVTSYTDTIDSISPITTLDFATGDWAEQTWYVRAKQSRADFADSDWSNTETILISSDVTAPVLSSPTDAVDGTTAYTGTVSTDEGNGTLYWVVSTASNAPSATQIIAGQMHTGAAAADADSQAVSGTGVQNIAGSGLSTNTQYYIHYAHRDAANNNSNVASAAGFSTDVTAPTLSSPVDASASDTTGTGSVSTNEGNGTLYFVVSTSGTPPSAAQVKAGNDHTGSAAVDSGNQAVSGTGVQTITGGFTGLTAATAYTAHYMHEDASGNQSSVSSGDGFTTDATGEAFGVTFVNYDTDATNASSYSLTKSGAHFSLGAADSNREFIIGIMYGKLDPAASVTSVKVTNIDGAGATGEVTASAVSGATTTIASGGATSTMALYKAAVPTGSTADIAVVFGDTVTRISACIYRIVAATVSGGTGTNSTSANTLSRTPTIPASGVAIFFAYSAANTSANAWTNLDTEDFDAVSETTQNLTGGRRTTAGSTAVSANWTSNAGCWMVCCVCEP